MKRKKPSQLDLLGGRVYALETAAKQSPSERCLFARVRELEARICRTVETAARPVKSAREQFLENENAWLRAELLRALKP